jgi:hypothetical protein
LCELVVAGLRARGAKGGISDQLALLLDVA